MDTLREQFLLELIFTETYFCAFKCQSQKVPQNTFFLRKTLYFSKVPFLADFQNIQGKDGISLVNQPR